MEQIPSWEANRFSPSQGIPRTLWKHKVHYRTHNSAPPVRTLRQINPVQNPHSTSWRSVLILSSHLRLGLLSGPFPLGFPTQHVPILSPYVLHISPTSFLLIWSPDFSTYLCYRSSFGSCLRLFRFILLLSSKKHAPVNNVVISVL